MEETQANPRPSIVLRLVKLPVQGLWFLMKHPVVALIIVLLMAFSSVSFLAHYNQAIAERFNNAAGYFIGATLLSEGSNVLRSRIAALETDVKTQKANIERKNKALKKASTDLKRSSEALHDGAKVIRRQGGEITSKNRALKTAINALRESSKALHKGADVIRRQRSALIGHDKRLTRFRDSGMEVEKKLPKRFSKVAIYDSAGELLGWLPIIGDAASIGLAAGGIYEMCQMFKEIEVATVELGVPYMIYTDTFCDKPAEITREFIADHAGQLKDSVSANVVILTDRAVVISTDTMDTIRSFFNQTFITLKNLL